MIDLRYGEVEEQLRTTVREMVAEQSPVTQVLAASEQGRPYDADLWRVLAGEMGLAGLAIAEEHGGAGAGMREAAVVLEELGRAVAPVPYLGSAVVATVTLNALSQISVAAQLLAELAGGATAALVVPLASSPPAARVQVRVDGGVLSGQVRGVADALGADTLLVPTDRGLYAVAADADGLAREPVVSLDVTRPLCDVGFAGTPGTLVAEPAEAAQAVAAGLSAGAALLASEQLGVAQWCLDTTVAYVNDRHQFGRPVGSFQAVKHRLADVWVQVAQARATARHAAGCVAAQDPDTPVAVAVAQAYCSPMAVHAAEECIQLHGGIGFTWEHPAHLFLKRAKADAVAFGTADRHRAQLARLVDLPAPQPA